MWLPTLQLAVRNLMLHKLRSALTMLGTILGVGSVIAMVAIGEGSKREAVEQIRQLGATNVILRSVKPEVTQRGGSASETEGASDEGSGQILEYGLTYKDFDILTATLPTVKLAVPIALLRRNAQQSRLRISNARILGTIPEYRIVKNLEVRRGRFLAHRDIELMSNVAVLAAGAAERLFSFEDPIGRTVLLGAGAYRVVGVLKPQASGSASPGAVNREDFNNDIYIPLSASRSRFGEQEMVTRGSDTDIERRELSEITLTVWSEDDVSQTAAMARAILRRSHPKGDDYEVQVPLELLQQAEREKRIWNMVLGSIAGISLLVGGIGIMNIMLASITERTREIGIRRALGAKRRHITVQFLVETMVLSATGGLLGIFLGVAIPFVVTRAAGLETTLTWWSVTLAFGISVAIGVVFGLYPARRASLMDPISALRHE